MIKRYIFDLDNTLIFTDMLNSESYNYALSKHGLEPIKDCTRITRNIVINKYPNIGQIKDIILLKQEYFVNNVQNTKPNKVLFKILQAQSYEFCYLWTSADVTRVQALLEFYKLNNAFNKIFYSSKKDLIEDIIRLCKLCECKSDELVIYEDNQYIIEKLRILNLNVIAV